jgi:hypothetical protein
VELEWVLEVQRSGGCRDLGGELRCRELAGKIIERFFWIIAPRFRCF